MYNGITIHFGDEMSLTELFKASGRPMSINHSQWKHYAGLEFIAKVQNAVGSANSVIRTFVGCANALGGKKGGGGTYAHWQIALEYARYLSPRVG